MEIEEQLEIEKGKICHFKVRMKQPKFKISLNKIFARLIEQTYQIFPPSQFSVLSSLPLGVSGWPQVKTDTLPGLFI